VTPTGWVKLAGVLFVGLVAQFALLDQLPVLGAHADLLLLLPISAGLLDGPQRGAIVGFLAGLVADLIVPLPYGLSALTYTIVGFGIGSLGSLPAGRDLVGSRLATGVAGSAGGTLLYALFASVVHQRDIAAANVAAAVLVVSLGALLLVIPVVSVMRWVLAGSRGSLPMPAGGSASS
jgi:rod shape-determining protein MreD